MGTATAAVVVGRVLADHGKKIIRLVTVPGFLTLKGLYRLSRLYLKQI
jgi:hypothetical protein